MATIEGKHEHAFTSLLAFAQKISEEQDIDPRAMAGVLLECSGMIQFTAIEASHTLPALPNNGATRLRGESEAEHGGASC